MCQPAATSQNYDVLRDGLAVVLARPAGDEPGRFEIVYHFAEELKRTGVRA